MPLRSLDLRACENKTHETHYAWLVYSIPILLVVEYEFLTFLLVVSTL